MQKLITAVMIMILMLLAIGCADLESDNRLTRDLTTVTETIRRTTTTYRPTTTTRPPMSCIDAIKTDDHSQDPAWTYSIEDCSPQKWGEAIIGIISLRLVSEGRRNDVSSICLEVAEWAWAAPPGSEAERRLNNIISDCIEVLDMVFG